MRRLLGLAMRAYRRSPLQRLYRRSPLHPLLGKAMASALVMPFAKGIVVKEVGGVSFELDLEEVIDSSLYFFGAFEERAEEVIASSAPHGKTAIDVGANFGYHTFRLARAVGPSARVLAIEPTAWAFGKLERNIGLNAFTNITALKLGLSDLDGGEAAVAFRSSFRRDGRRTEVTERIALRTLDSVVDEHRIADLGFIKIDVDGYETKVLRGAARTLERWRPGVFVEITPRLVEAIGDDWRECLRLLLSLDYRLSSEDGEPLSDPVAFFEQHRERSINVLARAR